jgi:hypothetical protein
MPSARATRILPATLVRAIVSLPPMLVATALWAAHSEHPTVTDLAIQATLLVFMAALLVNVIASVVAILREREGSDPGESRASHLTSDPGQGPSRAASPAKTPGPNP